MKARWHLLFRLLVLSILKNKNPAYFLLYCIFNVLLRTYRE
jgi:hypothetical protein